MSDPLIETWTLSNQVNLFLLEALDDAQLAVKVEKSKTPAGHFGHIHSVRLMWLKAAAPELLEGLEKAEESKAGLDAALRASGAAIGSLLEKGLVEGRIKGFKPHPQGFLGYLIAHEAFHRAQIELALRQAGMPISDKVAYGLWEWNSRA